MMIRAILSCCSMMMIEQQLFTVFNFELRRYDNENKKRKEGNHHHHSPLAAAGDADTARFLDEALGK